MTAGDRVGTVRVPMRLVRLLIWLATIFFAAMLFLPLVEEVFRRTVSGQLP